MRMVVAGLVIALLAGACVRFGFDHRSRGDVRLTGGDGANFDGSTLPTDDRHLERPPDGPRLDRGRLVDHPFIVPLDGQRPFGQPTLVAALSSGAGDDGPTLPADRMEIFFASRRNGGIGDIFTSTRSAATGTWTTPSAVTVLNGPSPDTWEDTPEISADGLTIYFSSNRAQTGQTDIFVSTRTNRTSPWTTPVMVTAFSVPNHWDYGAATNATGRYLVLHSDRSGNFDIYITSRALVSDPWTPLTALTSVNTGAVEGDAFLTADALGIFFSTDRPGGQGKEDIWFASRTSVNANFGPAAPVTSLNSAGQEQDLWISDDLRYVVFASDRSGVYQIYEASR